MTTPISKPAIPPPKDKPNFQTVQALYLAVGQLAGSMGLITQRAVRLCELLDAGVLQLETDGLVGLNTKRLSTEMAKAFVPLNSGTKAQVMDTDLRYDFNIGGVTQVRFQTHTIRRKDANSFVLTPQPRVFVQAGDPGLASEQGDVWITTASPPAIRTRLAGNVWSTPNV